MKKQTLAILSALMLALVSFQACTDDDDKEKDKDTKVQTVQPYSLDELNQNSVLTDAEILRIKQGCRKRYSDRLDEVSSCIRSFVQSTGPEAKAVGCLNDDFWNIFDCVDTNSCKEELSLKVRACVQERSVLYKDALDNTDFYKAYYAHNKLRWDCCVEQRGSDEDNGCDDTVNNPKELYGNVVNYMFGQSECLPEYLKAEQCWAKTTCREITKQDGEQNSCVDLDIKAHDCNDAWRRRATTPSQNANSNANCTQFTDKAIQGYAYETWDANFDGCIDPQEAAAVTRVGRYAFSENEELQSVDDLKQFPNLHEIGQYAFSECKNLTKVDLPQVTTLEEGAFEGCTALKTVNLPKATSIDIFSFRKCSALQKMSLTSPDDIHYSVGAGDSDVPPSVDLVLHKNKAPNGSGTPKADTDASTWAGVKWKSIAFAD